MSAQRTVSIQEAVHMVDNQDSVMCSEKFTCLSLRQGAMLASDKDTKKKKDIVTMHRNHSKDHADLSMDEYFHHHFCKEALDKKGDRGESTKHRILLAVGKIASHIAQSHVSVPGKSSSNTSHGQRTNP